MNTRDNQRGGIVLFAVIGVLLASLLAGALYLGKQQSEVAKNNTPTPIAIDTEKEATESANGAADTSKPEAAENKPATPATPTPSTQTPTSPATPKPAAPRVTTVPNSGPSEPLPSTGPSEPLPSTGPSETAFGILIVMAISFIVLAFVQSSRRLRRSALSR